jgi:hypothetical protein
MKIHALPRATLSWQEFLTNTPNHSVALDGYVAGEPRFDLNSKHANFNHHENVNRLATRCTASQVAVAIKQGLFSILDPQQIRIYVNDCDQDVCMAIWLLQNWERIVGIKSEPSIARLIFNVDMQDTCAGAYPVISQSRIMRDMCWIFAPYVRSRTLGQIHTMDSEGMLQIIETVCHRITLYTLGQGEQADPDTRYEIVMSGTTWKMVKEIGNEARTEMSKDGIQGFVSLRSDTPDHYVYSIGNLTPFGGLDLPKAYQALNTAEGIDPTNTNRWGGSDSCGGSPRDGGSKLSPQSVAAILNAL